MIKLGEVFSIVGQPERFLVRSAHQVKGAVVYGVTRIPDGMTERDFGLLFEAYPTDKDPCAYRLIDQPKAKE